MKKIIIQIAMMILLVWHVGAVVPNMNPYTITKTSLMTTDGGSDVVLSVVAYVNATNGGGPYLYLDSDTNTMYLNTTTTDAHVKSVCSIYNDTELIDLLSTIVCYSDGTGCTALNDEKLNISDQRFNDTAKFANYYNISEIDSIAMSVNTSLLLENYYNQTASDARYLPIADQRFNETVAINTKLTATDQRYNDTAAINAQAGRIDNLNTTKLTATDQRYNDTTLINTKLTATDQRYNDTVAIATKLDSTDQRYNDTTLISTKLTATDQRYNDTAAIATKLTATDQRYNETAAINTLSGKVDGMNTTANIQGLGFSTAVEAGNLYAETAGANTWTKYNEFNPDTNTTFKGTVLFYDDTFFIGTITFTNTSEISVGMSGVTLKNIANQTIGLWKDISGKGNFWTDGLINATGTIYENGVTLNSRYNDTAAIATKLDATDQRYNDTTLISTKLTATDQRYNDTAAIATKLDATDQRYNDTTLISTKLTATDQRYNDTAAIALKMDITSQIYNDTASVNTVNNRVTSVNTTAVAAMPKAGGTFTGNITMGSNVCMIWGNSSICGG